MARKPRFGLSAVPQHVIQRGNNREPCFFSEADYQFYLEYIRDAAERYQCAVHAYVLMTNHVHLLVSPEKHDSVPRFMQHIGRRYVQYINYAYRRSGTLWEGRYKASLVDVEKYLFTCYRYIELNPVRADMVRSPSEYPLVKLSSQCPGDTGSNRDAACALYRAGSRAVDATRSVPGIVSTPSRR